MFPLVRHTASLDSLGLVVLIREPWRRSSCHMFSTQMLLAASCLHALQSSFELWRFLKQGSSGSFAMNLSMVCEQGDCYRRWPRRLSRYRPQPIEAQDGQPISRDLQDKLALRIVAKQG